ncbi:MAG: tetratricopeptide repeat protein [Acidobacteriota bacterium]
MPRAAALLLLPLLAAADDRWLELRSGPFHVLASAGERGGQETLGQLEQFRHVLGTALGKQELRSVWPIRVLVVRPDRRAEAVTPPRPGRDAFLGVLHAEAPVPREWLRACALILLEANASRMPAGIESGLLDFYSTAEMSGTLITLGGPLPAAERNLDWARIQLLSVDPKYSGKLRVLLYNLQQGADSEPAFRNAFDKTPAEIDKEAAAYLAAASFATATISGRPLNARRDFRAEPAASPAPDLALADLRLSLGRLAEARAAYAAILKSQPGCAEAREGLGLVALREKNADEARRQLAGAIEAGSRNARAHLEYARLEPDRAKAAAALRKAAELNPGWSEPHFLLAQREDDTARKVNALSAAAKLAPRNAAYWRALAEAQMAASDFRAASRSWAAAEQASIDDAERARIQQARRSIEAQRLEAEAAARKREAEETQRELQRLKDAAMADIRRAEAKAERATGGRTEGKVEAWFEGPAPSGKIRGNLRQVDCLRGTARLVVQGEDGKLTRLVIRDPGKVVLIGGGQLALGCGPQRPPRIVTIEYFPKADPKLGTAGEVATVEYR